MLSRPEAEYRLQEVLKHDFWAFTGRYRGAREDGPRDVVVKIHRPAAFFGIPLGWAGRLLAFQEERILRRLQGIRGVPALHGRQGPHGVIREFVPGTAFRNCQVLTAEQVTGFRGLVHAIHARDVACVDLEKPENAVVGPAGVSLVDFQIAWYWPRRAGGGTYVARRLLRLLQHADRYHLAKLLRRGDPAQLLPEELRLVANKPWPLRLHAVLSRPLIRLRRGVLALVEPDRIRERLRPEERLRLQPGERPSTDGTPDQHLSP